MFQVLHLYIYYLASKEIKYFKTLRIIYYDENPVASHANNNGFSTNMGIVYVAPVQNKAGIHFMVNISDHEVQFHNNKISY